MCYRFNPAIYLLRPALSCFVQATLVKEIAEEARAHEWLLRLQVRAFNDKIISTDSICMNKQHELAPIRVVSGCGTL